MTQLTDKWWQEFATLYFDLSVLPYLCHHLSDNYVDLSYVSYLCQLVRSLCRLVRKKVTTSSLICFNCLFLKLVNFPNCHILVLFKLISEKSTLYIYHMASRVTYQNISPEVTRKPWRVMSPNADLSDVMSTCQIVMSTCQIFIIIWQVMAEICHSMSVCQMIMSAS